MLQKIAPDPQVDEATARRTEELYDQHRQTIFKTIDRLFAGLMLVQWLAGIAVALWISPRTWFGEFSQTHVHVWAAIFLGGVISLFPCALVLLCPGRTLNRYVIAVGQMMMSALLIHLSGGRIETHFHVFGSLVILSFYRDWRVLIPATVVVAIDHYVRGVFWPQSVYGVITAEPWRWLEHAGWVIFEDVFLFFSCLRGQQEMRFIAQRTAQLETTNKIIEDKVVRISHEIGERKQTEAALHLAKEEAERANRAKSEFLSRMSHELRTPMNAILGFAQLLELEDISAQQREGVAHILKAGRHLLVLINEVLDIARIESGRLSISAEPVRVRDIVQETLDLVRPIAAEKKVQLNGAEAVSCERHVLADRQRLKQVFLNLVSNAVKYNRPEGSVTISIETAAAPAAGNGAPPSKTESRAGRLRLVVRDTGHGIPKEKFARLFSPFDRLGAEQAGVEGTGLGLAVSKRLVEAMGGTMGLESTVGEGSTFWVELALVASPIEQQESAATEPAAGTERADASARTVLYIEDNLSNLRLVERILMRRPNVKLLAAMQGGLGVDLARQHRPDLVLLDVNLPDIEGDEVLAQLQSHPATAGIPVVVISADAMQSQIDRLLKAGARAYLTKPLEVVRFLELLDELLKADQKSLVAAA